MMQDLLSRPDDLRDLERIIAATREFSPQRLTLAREMAGLDIKELAGRIEATPSAVSQFEKGSTRPKTETIIRLALALGVPPEFFAAEPVRSLSVDTCFFRSLRSASVKERKRVLAYGSVMNRVADYLYEFVNFPTNQLDEFRVIMIDGLESEALAGAVRDAWNLGYGPIRNMIALLEAKGVLVVEVPGHSARMDAFSTWVDDRPLIFLTPYKNSGSRRRFDTAHELAHLILHRDKIARDPEEEREADAFASAFLLPKAPFLAECPKRLDWSSLRRLKKRWGVSLAAIVRRAFDLGIFSEATYRRAYLQLNQLGWRVNEPDEPEIEYPALLQRAVGLLHGSGHTLRRIASDLRLGEGLLERLIFPPRTQQGVLFA